MLDSKEKKVVIFMTNKVQWSRRVPPYKVHLLYENDAKGILDEDLLNDVGYGIYACCQDLLERGDASRGRVKCRNCNNLIIRPLINGQFANLNVIRCSLCGWEVACKDYHQSCLRKRPAPPYEPEEIFKQYAEQWPLASSPREKLLLIDRLIHEWHIHYITVGWPLGTSVIQATARQMVDLLERLGYGYESSNELKRTRMLWMSRLKVRRSKLDLKEVARELGIEGINKMRKQDLIDAIERVDPQFFKPWLDLIDAGDDYDHTIWRHL
jgi:hypothetical protein